MMLKSPNYIKKKKLRFLITNNRLVLLTATILYFSTFLWMSYPYSIVGEGLAEDALFKWIQLVKADCGLIQKPEKEDLLFIDISKDKKIVSESDENLITDRLKLSQFLHIINENNIPIQYILCDIYFTDTTMYDRELQAELDKLTSKIIIGHLPDQASVINATLGSIENEEHKATYKVPLHLRPSDTFLPLKMYSDIYHVSVKQNFLFSYFVGKGLSFNCLIPNPYICNTDIGGQQYSGIELGNLVDSSDLDTVKQRIKNKFIIIGNLNFEDSSKYSDMHDTYFESMFGSLILFNVFLDLKYGKNIISPFYLVLLFFFIYSMVWIKFNDKAIHVHFKSFNFKLNLLSELILIVAFTITSHFLFGIQISLFNLFIFFFLYEIYDFIKPRFELILNKLRSK